MSPLRRPCPLRLIRTFALVALTASEALALDPSKAISQYVHRSWQTEDGLPHTSVQSMAQTPDGYLWIGTGNGLARFDGVKFTVYDKANTPQIRDGSINALRVDRRGTLWIATSAGITIYSDGRFQALDEKAGLPVTASYTLLESQNGEMWIPFAGAIYHGRPGRFRREKLPNDGDVLTLAEFAGGIWAGGYGGLTRLDGGSVRSFTIADGLPDNNVSFLAVRGDALWIGTLRGIARWQSGVIRPAGPLALRGVEVWAILFDRDGSQWFGTRSGLVRMRGEAAETYKAADGLTNDFIESLLEDREGSLWVGTHLGGLNQFHDGAFTTYSAAEGLPADTVWSAVNEPGVGVWIGSEGGGLALLAGGKVKRVPVGNGPSVRTATTTARTSDGTLWVGTFGQGVFRLRDGRWSSLTRKDGLGDDIVASLEVQGSTVWAGTLHGLTRIDGDHLVTVRPRDGLPGDTIFALHADRFGRLWVATDRGVCVMDGARCVARLGATVLPSKSTWCIHEDPRGGLWFGTRAGLFSISPTGAARFLTSREGLPQDKIFQIEQDGDGDFWMGFGRGVFRATRAEMEQGRIPNRVVLGTSDGMKKAECTWGAHPSSSVGADGSIWFPTTRGVARLDPARAKLPRRAPLLRIEEVVIDGRSRPADPELRLEPAAESLEFHYTAPSFLAPERLHYRYRLAGYDAQWVDAGTRRIAYYAHLPPGRYTFSVTASDGGPAAEIALPLVVLPRFTQTLWFELLVVLAGIAAVALLYVARVRAVRARYDAVLAERSRIAREFHDTLAQGLVGLSYNLDGALGAIGSEGRELERMLRHARELAATCLSETRRSVQNLRTGMLRDVDLVSALTTLATRGRATGPPIDLKIVGTPYRIQEEAEQNVLRIAQEAVANALQHSGAEHIEITLAFGESALELVVSDDGKGPPRGDSGPLRFGLLGMQERARAMRGKISIGSRPSGGTTVRLTMPARSRFFGIGQLFETRRR